LADAFGLPSLTNTPGRVQGAWPGELWALMLDPKDTFDAAVVRRLASLFGSSSTIIPYRTSNAEVAS
jgi:hypothetical protein